jgi:RNA polymerase sigma factor (TIGR02999 family)
MHASRDLTGLLLAWGRGDAAAQSALMTAVYEDLRRMARLRVRGEHHDDRLTPTALVHETYLRLINQKRVRWQNRAQFFALAARLMRRVLVDHARARAAAKREAARMRSSDWTPVSSPRAAGSTSRCWILTCSRSTMHWCGSRHSGPRHSTLVELRFFGGLSIEEAAKVLNVSPATAKRDWTLARAWLYRELCGEPPG